MHSSAASELNSAFGSDSSAPFLSPSLPLLWACAGLLSFGPVCYACGSLIPCCSDADWVLCSVAPVCRGWSMPSHPGTIAGGRQGWSAGWGSTQLNEQWWLSSGIHALQADSDKCRHDWAQPGEWGCPCQWQPAAPQMWPGRQEGSNLETS